jgi:hypothetical protein
VKIWLRRCHAGTRGVEADVISSIVVGRGGPAIAMLVITVHHGETTR